MIIGICGKSGSGKSTLAKELSNKYSNSLYIDIDKVGHFVLSYEEVKKELINNFGENILLNNQVDRKKLGNLVFNSREKMKRLSDITWKYMQIEIDNIISNNKDEIIILDWILLPLTKYLSISDVKILLDISYDVRRERAMLRDNITSEDFDTREKASIDYNKNDFDYVIKDNGEVKELVRKL